MQRPPLSLYIHFPWCIKKCPYCDFNSHAVKEAVPEQRYVDAMLADLAQDAEELTDGQVFSSIFMGGGTPSLFSPEAIGCLLVGVRRQLQLAEDCEITLEANPGTFESDKFRAFRQLGINRLSIGIQSFNPQHLQRLGRVHSADEALQAVAIAQAAGFDNLNVDLMFGLPDQTQAEAIADIDTAIALKPTHISFYQLTLEPNTYFHRYPPALPEDEAIYAVQQACQQRHKADQFGIMPCARALIVKEPNQQCRADGDAQDAVNGASVICEHLCPLFCPQSGGMGFYIKISEYEVDADQ
jgi:oxygen-independent coproporphyrinogen-3 oxidase